MKSDCLRALVVEDDHAWQQILAEILGEAGVIVDLAVDLETALACLRSTAHRLAIVDLALGNGDLDNQDGLAVLDTLRDEDPGCAVILLTGFATVELAVSAITEHGAVSCLRKEVFDRREFRRLVERALASEPARAPEQGPAQQSRTDSPSAPSESRERVVGPRMEAALLVEDDVGWQGILAELLGDAGYRIRLCRSFGEALGCLRRESYALAVVDLALDSALSVAVDRGLQLSDRDLDGYALLRYTRAAGVPTIVVSGVTASARIERAYAEQGVFAYLEKQAFDRRAFARALDDLHATCATGEALAPLTERECEVLRLLAQGKTNKEIATDLMITPNTVKRHLRAIFDKLGVHTRAAAAAIAIGAGYLPPASEGLDSAPQGTEK